jgi:hypothetical protein
MIRLTGLIIPTPPQNKVHHASTSTLVPALRMLREVRELTEEERNVLDAILSELELVPAPFTPPDVNKDGVVDDADKRINDRRRQRLEEIETTHSHIDDTEDEVDDHEGEMAKSSLLALHKQAGELYNMLGDNEQLEGWVQAKITKAADYINAVYNNMQYEKRKPAAIGNGDGAPADKMPDRMMESAEPLNEKAPKGWEKTVLAMKKKKEIDNPWALAHWMKSKGYHPKAGKSE